MPAQWLLEFARLGHAFAQTGKQSIDAVAVEPGELHDLHRHQVRRDMPQEPAKNSLRNSCTDDIAVSHWKTSLSR